MAIKFIYLMSVLHFIISIVNGRILKGRFGKYIYMQVWLKERKKVSSLFYFSAFILNNLYSLIIMQVKIIIFNTALRQQPGITDTRDRFVGLRGS